MSSTFDFAQPPARASPKITKWAVLPLMHMHMPPVVHILGSTWGQCAVWLPGLQDESQPQSLQVGCIAAQFHPSPEGNRQINWVELVPSTT